ncbi:MAG: acetyl-CoA C-acyltransferase [Janthinobacterium lividum]
MKDLVILGWGRSAVCPVGGALSMLAAHEIASPVIRAVLANAGIDAGAIDFIVAGNALGAGGNPARMAALAAGLADQLPALSVDTQCCAGLDAISMAAALLGSGAAGMVLAGGVEAWSRAPLRQHRPIRPGEPAIAFERPAFAPDPARDPDLLQAAASHALEQRISRLRQDLHAVASHQRAFDHRAVMAAELTVIGAAVADSHVRQLSPQRAARMPVAAMADAGLAAPVATGAASAASATGAASAESAIGAASAESAIGAASAESATSAASAASATGAASAAVATPPSAVAQQAVASPPHKSSAAGAASMPDGQADARAHAISRLAVAPRADGAAFVVLATQEAAAQAGLTAHFRWHGGISVGAAPEKPMLAAIDASSALLARCHRTAADLWAVELHDAFAVQALAYLDHFCLDAERLNRHGGGLARGHPIAASGAIALVRLLNDMHRLAPRGALGMAAIAGAGGIGAAALVERL